VESHPVAYKELLENIRLNNLEGVVTSINAALSTKPGVVCVENINIEETVGAYYEKGRCALTVPAITLGEILDKYTDSDDIVLKMDREGCEYDVILNDYNHVRMFKEVIFEYHTYVTNIPLQNLLKRLTRDYLCKVVERGQDRGLVHCTKK